MGTLIIVGTCLRKQSSSHGCDIGGSTANHLRQGRHVVIKRHFQAASFTTEKSEEVPQDASSARLTSWAHPGRGSLARKTK